MSFAQNMRTTGPARGITAATVIDCDIPVVRALAEGLRAGGDKSAPAWKQVSFHSGIPSAVRESIADASQAAKPPGDEEYFIVCGDGIDVYASTPRGLYYGCQTLVRLCRNGKISAVAVHDYPLCPVRGVKLLLPDPAAIGEFKRFIDMAAAYKYNTVMIEVGGAMEYRRHPKINSNWISYCQEMNEYPGKGQKIQGSYGWAKNSIHSGNGGGKVLTQDAVRDLVAYCREKMMTVIPEVPLLSHCDYLVMAYPEIRERKDDPYPDVYCPSHPDTYPIVFDILDEVVDVFAPEVVNIGHDEYYSIALCDRCRGRDAAEIFADDIRRIHGRLANKGVRTMIWAEKLVAARSKSGAPLGGAKRWEIPATDRAIDLVPRDLEILHWYWSIDRKLEDAYYAHGMPVTYGNFAGSVCPQWRDRAAREGFRGAIISNWGATDAVTLQRNGILYEVVYDAFMFWNRRFDETHAEELSRLTYDELFRYRRRIRRQERGAVPSIVLRHTTDVRMKYVAFVDGYYVDPAKYLLGHYVVKYAGGATHEVPVLYGQNVASREHAWERKISPEYDCYEGSIGLVETSYTTIPHRDESGTWYEFETDDPHPEEKIVDVSIRMAPGVTGKLFLQSWSRRSADE